MGSPLSSDLCVEPAGTGVPSSRVLKGVLGLFTLDHTAASLGLVSVIHWAPTSTHKVSRWSSPGLWISAQNWQDSFIMNPRDLIMNALDQAEVAAPRMHWAGGVWL